MCLSKVVVWKRRMSGRDGWKGQTVLSVALAKIKAFPFHKGQS